MLSMVGVGGGQEGRGWKGRVLSRLLQNEFKACPSKLGSTPEPFPRRWQSQQDVVEYADGNPKNSRSNTNICRTILRFHET